MQLIKAFNSSFFRNKWFFLFTLTFLWFLTAIFVNPVGEFPLNDDWAYSKNVYDLAINGILKFNDWPAMTLIAQTLWGTLFCKIFGFSFTVLRMSGLVAGCAGMITIFLLARKIVLNDVQAFFFALILAFNPLYFCLSYSYMTEVPFLASILGALYFYFRYYKDQKITYLLLATGFVLIATMIRQMGILLAIALVFATLINGKIKLKQIILQTVLTCFILAFLFGFTYYLKAHHVLSSNFGSINNLFSSFILIRFIDNFYYRGSILLFYSGLLLLPMVIFILPTYYKNVKPKVKYIAACISALFAIPIIRNLSLVPCKNIINNLGLGPKLLKDSFWGYNQHPVLSPDIMKVIYAVGTLGAVLLIFTFILSLIRWKNTQSGSPVGKFKVQILLMIGGYMFFIMLFDYFYDRYFLPVILVFILLLLSPEIKVKRLNLAVSTLLFLGLAFFSISGTQDYLSFNRARWVGLRNLINTGISPHSIDGGFEFNGWYETGSWSWKQSGMKDKSWWFVDDDTYMLSLGNVCGYRKIATLRYYSLLTFGQDSILIVKRSDCYQDSTVISCCQEGHSSQGHVILHSLTNIKSVDANKRPNKEAHTGKDAVLLDSINRFGCTVHIKDVEHCEKFRVSVWCRNNLGHKAGIVITGPNVDWLYVTSGKAIKTDGDWELIDAEAHLYLGYPSSEVVVYLWNYGKDRVLFDDMTITRYRNPVF